MIAAAALLALCVPVLFAIGSYEHHAGRKGLRWAVAACVVMGTALTFAWAAGREHGLEAPTLNRQEAAA